MTDLALPVGHCLIREKKIGLDHDQLQARMDRLSLVAVVRDSCRVGCPVVRVRPMRVSSSGPCPAPQ
jgi:hypothetical protein